MKTFRKQLHAEMKDRAFAQAFQEERELRDMALKIADKRAELGLTQFQLARRAQITQQQLSRVETGTNCTMSTFLRVCSALGLEVGLSTGGRKTCMSTR